MRWDAPQGVGDGVVVSPDASGLRCGAGREPHVEGEVGHVERGPALVDHRVDHVLVVGVEGLPAQSVTRHSVGFLRWIM